MTTTLADVLWKELRDPKGWKRLQSRDYDRILKDEQKLSDRWQFGSGASYICRNSMCKAAFSTDFRELCSEIKMTYRTCAIKVVVCTTAWLHTMRPERTQEISTLSFKETSQNLIHSALCGFTNHRKKAAPKGLLHYSLSGLLNCTSEEWVD